MLQKALRQAESLPAHPGLSGPLALAIQVGQPGGVLCEEPLGGAGKGTSPG